MNAEEKRKRIRAIGGEIVDLMDKQQRVDDRLSRVIYAMDTNNKPWQIGGGYAYVSVVALYFDRPGTSGYGDRQDSLDSEDIQVVLMFLRRRFERMQVSIREQLAKLNAELTELQKPGQ